jgi:hypothetical protein
LILALVEVENLISNVVEKRKSKKIYLYHTDLNHRQLSILGKSDKKF